LAKSVVTQPLPVRAWRSAPCATRVAKSLLDPELLNLAIVGPFEDEQRFRDALVPEAVLA
jgi:hypothetical protein